MPQFLDPLKTAKSTLPFSPVVQAGNLVFVSGHIGVDRTTGRMAGDDIAAQTKQALRNIFSLLNALGLSASHVVKTTVFLTEMRDFAEMNAAYREAFHSDLLPARTTVAVKELPRPEALVEIEVVAVTT
jgi:2-iminobutanoate/2-iminopropanoate deaminase